MRSAKKRKASTRSKTKKEKPCHTCIECLRRDAKNPYFELKDLRVTSMRPGRLVCAPCLKNIRAKIHTVESRYNYWGD